MRRGPRYTQAVSDRPPPPKKDVANALVERGSLFVHLDPRSEGVVVPPWLAKQPQLVLQVGLDLAVPIPDLRIDDDGVFGTLSFNRSPFACSVPWSAVFALVDDEGIGMVWPEDLPAELAAEVEAATRANKPAAAAPPKPAKRAGPSLRAIEGGGQGEGEGAPEGEPPEPTRPRLRLVK